MVKKFNEYIDESFMEKLKIKSIHRKCKRYGIKNYTINDDMSIDVDGDVRLDSRFDSKKDPEPVFYGPWEKTSKLFYLPLKFNKVNGNFNCSNNQLVTLKDSPVYVSGNFHCIDNNLETLEGSPKYVGGNFRSGGNLIYDLKGCPKEVGGVIYVSTSNLIDPPGGRCSPIAEILQLFVPKRIISFDGSEPYDLGEKRTNSQDILKEIFSIWNNFNPVYKIGGKWHVDNIRLNELYYYITNRDYVNSNINKNSPEFKNFLKSSDTKYEPEKFFTLQNYIVDK